MMYARIKIHIIDNYLISAEHQTLKIAMRSFTDPLLLLIISLVLDIKR